MDTKKLIYKCQKGDRKAEKLFYEKYANLLYAVVLRYSKNAEEAEEFLLQGFLKVFNALEGFNYINDASLVGWLKKIVINEALMERRKDLNTLYRVDNFDEAQFEEPLIEEETTDEKLEEAVNNLPDGYRTVFLMFVVDGYSHKEIANTLSITEGTSRSQFFKARKLLQKQLSNNYGRAYGI